ncbi:hypothetical protein SNL152K_9349 [Streptomyces sp. NL15-2K]|nr:hypothetical protein SNL152K_9349 [Streptomyces sp. NL15-2K]
MPTWRHHRVLHGSWARAVLNVEVTKVYDDEPVLNTGA